jgi:hypothetical protein
MVFIPLKTAHLPHKRQPFIIQGGGSLLILYIETAGGYNYQSIPLCLISTMIQFVFFFHSQLNRRNKDAFNPDIGSFLQAREKLVDQSVS